MRNLNTNRRSSSTPIQLNGGSMIELPKTRTRYIIIDDSNGVFLGTYTMADFEEEIESNFLQEGEYIAQEDLDRSFALFAKDNPFSIHRACSFASVEEAQRFIKDSFGKTAKNLKLDAFPVETTTYYPDIVDLIKSGYSQHTFDMLDGIESPSKKMH